MQVIAAARDGDVEKTPFFLQRVGFFQRARSGEHAFGQPDNKDRTPFEAFGLVHGGKHDTIGVGIVARAGAVHIGEQGNLGEELLERGKLPGVAGERAQVLAAILKIGELGFHVVLVDGFHHRLDGEVGRDGFPLGGDFVERGGQLLPDFRGAGRWFGHAQNFTEGRGGFGAGFHDRPQTVGRFFPHPGQQPDHAAESGFVAGVEREFQKGGHVLHMGLLEEAQSAGHLERNTAAGQLELDFHRVEMRTVKHSHLAELEALAVEFEDLLRDVSGLVVVGRQLDKRGTSAGLAPGAQTFFELADIAPDGGIGHVEDAGHAAIVGLDAVGLRAGVALGEFEDVFEIGPAPRVDRLGVVAHHHDVAVLRSEQIDEIGLHEVGVLILVDEHVVELVAVMIADLGMIAQQLVRADEQVVEIHGVGRDLATLVGGADGGDGVGHAVEVTEAIMHEDIERVAGVGRQREQLGEHIGFGKTFVARHTGIVDHALQEVGLILAVEDTEAGFESDDIRVAPQDAVADGVEGATPNAVGIGSEQFGNASGHFAGRFVGEGEEEDLPRLDPVLEQPGHAVGERACLAAAGAGDDQRGATRRGDGSELLLVQLGRVVDAGAGGRREVRIQSRNPHSSKRRESLKTLALLLPSMTAMMLRPLLCPLETRQCPAALVKPVFMPVHHGAWCRMRLVLTSWRTRPSA